MNEFRLDQKWISTAEPELGMGRVTEVSTRTVSLRYDRVSEDRTYASQKAPLVRVRFNIGDLVTNNADITISVTSIEDKDDLLTYIGPIQGATEDQTLCTIHETALDPNVIQQARRPTADSSVG